MRRDSSRYEHMLCVLFLSLILFGAPQRTVAQTFTSGDGSMEFIRCGMPVTLLPHDTTGVGVTPQMLPYSWGDPMTFQISAAPGELYLVSYSTSDDIGCHERTRTSFATDALYWIERDTLLDPNIPQPVVCDSTGHATFRLGITVEFPPLMEGSFEGSFGYVSASGRAVNIATGDTLRAESAVGALYIACQSRERSMEIKGLVRGHTYTLTPDTAGGALTPLLSGAESAQSGVVYVLTVPGDTAYIEWPNRSSTLASDDGGTLQCSFAPDAGLLTELGQRFNPNVITVFATGPDCGLTIQLGITVIIPQDAAPGEYYGAILGVMIYIGNLKDNPEREPRKVTMYGDIIVTVAEGDLPESPLLLQNYPNPFNSGTKIRYALAQPQHVTLEIYDVLGRRVATLVDGAQIAGPHEVPWPAESLSSGVYLYRLQTPTTTQVRKLLLMR